MYLEAKRTDLTPEEKQQVDDSLLKGVVSRASIISFLYAFTFGMYSFTSYDFIQHFSPDLTIFDNTWPRLLFNVLPLLALGIYFRNYEKNPKLKAWIWAIGLPIIFASACLIHVWPLMWKGNANLYFYVHAANLFIIATSFIVISPPAKLIFIQILAFIAMFVVPIGYLLLRVHETRIFNMAMGDFFIGYTVTAYSSYMVYKLRYKIALFDLRSKKAASPFLGAALMEAIYEQRTHLLDTRRVLTVILKIDIRGYTDFYRKNAGEVVRRFMTGYHGIVSRSVGQTEGYWHKSIGDGQLASYGAMNPDPDLSDIPGIELEMASAEERKCRAHFENALRAATSISHQFERLKEKFDVKDSLSLGMAIAYGEVEVRVQGDDTHKMELDIDGEVILRCSRLESYTKDMQKELGVKTSIIVLSPELIPLSDTRMFKTWSTATRPELQIRSFPEIAHIAYHVFRDADERREFIRKLRAS